MTNIIIPLDTDALNATIETAKESPDGAAEIVTGLREIMQGRRAADVAVALATYFDHYVTFDGEPMGLRILSTAFQLILVGSDDFVAQAQAASRAALADGAGTIIEHDANPPAFAPGTSDKDLATFINARRKPGDLAN